MGPIEDPGTNLLAAINLLTTEITTVYKSRDARKFFQTGILFNIGLLNIPEEMRELLHPLRK